MKPKVALLQRMGFQGTRLRTLLVGCPAVLAVSRKQLERRWRWEVGLVVGWSTSRICELPRHARKGACCGLYFSGFTQACFLMQF